MNDVLMAAGLNCSAVDREEVSLEELKQKIVDRFTTKFFHHNLGALGINRLSDERIIYILCKEKWWYDFVYEAENIFLQKKFYTDTCFSRDNFHLFENIRKEYLGQDVIKLHDIGIWFRLKRRKLILMVFSYFLATGLSIYFANLSGWDNFYLALLDTFLFFGFFLYFFKKDVKRSKQQAVTKFKEEAVKIELLYQQQRGEVLQKLETDYAFQYEEIVNELTVIQQQITEEINALQGEIKSAFEIPRQELKRSTTKAREYVKWLKKRKTDKDKILADELKKYITNLTQSIKTPSQEEKLVLEALQEAQAARLNLDDCIDTLSSQAEFIKKNKSRYDQIFEFLNKSQNRNHGDYLQTREASSQLTKILNSLDDLHQKIQSAIVLCKDTQTSIGPATEILQLTS